MHRQCRKCPRQPPLRVTSLHRLTPLRCLMCCIAIACIVANPLLFHREDSLPSLTDVHLRYIRIRVNNGSRTPINTHPFTYLLNNERACAVENNLFLLIYVHSAPNHFKRRQIIRETWGHRKYYSRTMRIIFVLGRTDGSLPEVDALLLQEHAENADIVKEDFLGTYRNLTYKAIAALKWTSTYCKNATYVLKCDDDMIVNPFTLMNYLERKVNVAHIMCHVYKVGYVFRTSERHAVTEEEYGVNLYPKFCSGSAFIMTTDTAIALHEVSYSVPFLWLDDVYVTGLLTFKLGNVIFEQLSDKYELKKQPAVVSKLAAWWWASYMFGHVPDMDVFWTV